MSHDDCSEEQKAPFTPTIITMHITEIIKLLQFGDSMLPVGAFSFSNGLESAVQVGLVHDLASLKDYTVSVLGQAAEVDGVALLCAHRAAESEATDEITAIDQALFNRKLNEEMRLMSTRMGRKLAELGGRVLKARQTTDWLDRIKQKETPGTFPIGQGILFCDLGLDESAAFSVHQYGVASMILGASIRLMRVDHLDTQRLLFEVNETADLDYERVKDRELKDMASYTPALDILAGIHVKAHMRLFMN